MIVALIFDTIRCKFEFVIFTFRYLKRTNFAPNPLELKNVKSVCL